jgi:hypothetical protein
MQLTAAGEMMLARLVGPARRARGPTSLDRADRSPGASQGILPITLMWFHDLNVGIFARTQVKQFVGIVSPFSPSSRRDMHCAEAAQSNNILFSVQRLLAARGSDTPAGHSCRNRVHAGDCQHTPEMSI